MRRTLIGQGNRPTLGFALGLPLHQHVEPPHDARDLAFLPRDDAGQVLRDTRQMRHRFLEPLGSLQRLLVHAPSIR